MALQLKMVETYPTLAKKRNNSQRPSMQKSDQEAAIFLKKIGVE